MQAASSVIEPVTEDPLFGCRSKGKGYLLHGGAGTVWHKKIQRKNGQNLIEYAIVVAVIAAVMLAMSTYVFRSVQATQQMIQKGFSD